MQPVFAHPVASDPKLSNSAAAWRRRSSRTAGCPARSIGCRRSALPKNRSRSQTNSLLNSVFRTLGRMQQRCMRGCGPAARLLNPHRHPLQTFSAMRLAVDSLQVPGRGGAHRRRTQRPHPPFPGGRAFQGLQRLHGRGAVPHNGGCDARHARHARRAHRRRPAGGNAVSPTQML